MESTIQPSTGHSRYRGTNKLLTGIVFSVLTFWLFAQSFVNIAPQVQADLGISDGILGIGISVTALMSGIFIVVAGSLADRLGRVRLTYVGLLLNIIGSLALVVTTGAPLFLIGRVLQGLSPLVSCLTMALVKTYYDGKERQRGLSFWSIGSWGGSGFCSFFGGAVASSLGWRWIFIFSIIISVISGLFIKGVRESKVTTTNKQAFDFAGLILFVIAMMSLNIGVSQGATLGWTSPTIIVLFVTFIIGIFLFYKVETSKSNSFVDFSLFDNREFTRSNYFKLLAKCRSGNIIRYQHLRSTRSRFNLDANRILIYWLFSSYLNYYPCR